MQFYSTWRKPKISGIYGFFHRASGKCYVGSAVDLFLRRADHHCHLRAGTSSCPKLQRAWNKYGEAAFTWCIIEIVEDKTRLVEREQHWIDWLNSCKGGYNTSPTAGNTLGTPCSPEKAAKIAEALRGRPGRPATDEARRKMSEALKGRQFSDEHRAKIRAHMAGKPFPVEAAAKGHEANRGKHRSAETRAKQSARILEVFSTPEMKEKLRQRGRGRKLSPEQIEILRRANLGRKASPEARAKMSEARRGSKHPRAKLTEDDVREMRRRYAAGGITYKALGAEYGIGENPARAVVVGITWKHVQ